MLLTLTILRKFAWKTLLTSSKIFKILSVFFQFFFSTFDKFSRISSKLLTNEGIVIEPNVNDLRKSNEEAERNYFPNTEAELEEILSNNPMLDEGSDEDESSFEKIGQKMTNVTPDGGVKKRIIKGGVEMDGSIPEKGSITIHYSMRLEYQDEPFDSSYFRGRAERYRLDDGQLLPGLEMGIRTMKNTERAEFLIHPDYGFGEMGCPPRVPQSAFILARVELLAFAGEGQSESMLALAPEERHKVYTFRDVLAAARQEHLDGNKYVGKEEYKLAAKCFERGVKLLDDAQLADDDEEKEQKRLILKLLLNRGLCYLKLKWPKKACIALQKALEIDSQSIKALYRMGKAKRMLCDYKDARKYLVKALNIEPQNTDVGQEFASLETLMKQQDEDERALCKRMFGSSNQRGHSMPSRRLPPNVARLDDETYSQITDQLSEFKLDETQSEFHLPSGFDMDTISVVQHLCSQMGLSVEKGRLPNQHIVKKSYK